MLLLELRISPKNCLIKVIDLHHLMLYPFSPMCRYKKTIDIILKKVYVENVTNTTIKKNSMRKLIKYICKKTAFVFDN